MLQNNLPSIAPKTSNFLLGSTAMTTSHVAAIAFAAGLLSLSSIANAEMPTGANVTGGTATVTSDATSMLVNQESKNAVIEFNTYNSSAGTTITYDLAHGALGTTVNLIHDANPSTILGSLTSNGQLVLLNPNGVFFGKSATVDVAGDLPLRVVPVSELVSGYGYAHSRWAGT